MPLPGENCARAERVGYPEELDLTSVSVPTSPAMSPQINHQKDAMKHETSALTSSVLNRLVDQQDSPLLKMVIDHVPEEDAFVVQLSSTRLHALVKERFEDSGGVKTKAGGVISSVARFAFVRGFPDEDQPKWMVRWDEHVDSRLQPRTVTWREAWHSSSSTSSSSCAVMAPIQPPIVGSGLTVYDSQRQSSGKPVRIMAEKFSNGPVLN